LRLRATGLRCAPLVSIHYWLRSDYLGYLDPKATCFHYRRRRRARWRWAATAHTVAALVYGDDSWAIPFAASCRGVLVSIPIPSYGLRVQVTTATALSRADQGDMGGPRWSS